MFRLRKIPHQDLYLAQVDEGQCFRNLLAFPSEDGWTLRYEVGRRNEDGSFAGWSEERSYRCRSPEEAKGIARAIAYELTCPNVVTFRQRRKREESV
ncbi:MAG: hypothetical protein ACE5H8_15505 [Alphaproteobacteria bacterium]